MIRKHKRRGRVGIKTKAAPRLEEAEADQAGGSVSEEGGETPKDTSQTVGQSTVRNYTNAIVDLWSKQQAVSGSQIAHPRAHAAVKQIMQTLERQEATRKISHHNNRRDGQYPFSLNCLCIPSHCLDGCLERCEFGYKKRLTIFATLDSPRHVSG